VDNRNDPFLFLSAQLQYLPRIPQIVLIHILIITQRDQDAGMAEVVLGDTGYNNGRVRISGPHGGEMNARQDCALTQRFYTAAG